MCRLKLTFISKRLITSTFHHCIVTIAVLRINPLRLSIQYTHVCVTIDRETKMAFDISRIRLLQTECVRSVLSCQDDFKISFWKSNEPRTKGLFISQRFSIPFLINENGVDLNCISCHRTCDSIVAEKRFSQTSHATINDSTEQGYFNDEFILCKRGR